MSKFYDFVEIGTSDFNTLIQEAGENSIGLSVDPVASYLDRLPSPVGCSKLNAAVSDKNGQLEVYYLQPELIAQLELPYGLRGCNSIGGPHPAVMQVLTERGIPETVISRSIVPVFRLITLAENYGMSGIYHLKIDTEGHEVQIINDFFDNCRSELYPHNLVFETNSLGDSSKIHHLIARLILLGYDIIRSETGGMETDTHLRLNIRRLTCRTKFTDAVPGYYLAAYPDEYNPNDPPHNNTLQDAQSYSASIGSGGVTYQYGRYEVRDGRYLLPDKHSAELKSWILGQE